MGLTSGALEVLVLVLRLADTGGGKLDRAVSADDGPRDGRGSHGVRESVPANQG